MFEFFVFSLMGFGVLVVNVFCVYIFVVFWYVSGLLIKVVFFFVCNDVIVNVVIIVVGVVIFLVWYLFWFDLIVGFGIVWMNFDVVKEVWMVVNEEYKVVI